MSKYNDGYWPKIQYCTNKINDEFFNPNRSSDEVMYFHKKLKYFIGKQWDLDNPIKQETFQVL